MISTCGLYPLTEMVNSCSSRSTGRVSHDASTSARSMDMRFTLRGLRATRTQSRICAGKGGSEAGRGEGVGEWKGERGEMGRGRCRGEWERVMSAVIME